MELKRVITAFFSPTGGTKKVAMALQDGFLDGIPQLEPSVQSYNCLTPVQRQNKVPTFDEQDLLVFCFPVFKGRLPLALQDWPELKGNGASAVVVSVYGNRAIEDAAREAMAMLQDHGFKIIGHIEALAEHSLERSIGAGRPNSEDKAKLCGIAKEILEKCAKSTETKTSLPELTFDRTTPLKPLPEGTFAPEPIDSDACEKCGRCANICPMGIIDPMTQRVAPENIAKCISCLACTQACRHALRRLPPAVVAATAEKMAKMKAANPDPKPIKFVMG